MDARKKYVQEISFDEIYNDEEEGVRVLIKSSKIAEDGMFVQIFGSMFGAYLKDGSNIQERRSFIEKNHKNFRSLCMWNKAEFVYFAKKFPEKLHREGFDNYFLLGDNSGRLFIANATVVGDDIIVIIDGDLEIEDVKRAGGGSHFFIRKQEGGK